MKLIELQITQTRHPQSVVDRRTDALTFGYLLGTYSVRKSSQESVNTQPIPDNFLPNKPLEISEILSTQQGSIHEYGQTDGRIGPTT